MTDSLRREKLKLIFTADKVRVFLYNKIIITGAGSGSGVGSFGFCKRDKQQSISYGMYKGYN